MSSGKATAALPPDALVEREAAILEGLHTAEIDGFHDGAACCLCAVLGSRLLLTFLCE